MMRVAVVLGLVVLVGVACGVEPADQVPSESTSEPQTTLATAPPETEEETLIAVRNEGLGRQLQQLGVDPESVFPGPVTAEQTLALSERLDQLKLREAQQEMQQRIAARNRELKRELRQRGIDPAVVVMGPASAEQNLALIDWIDRIDAQGLPTINNLAPTVASTPAPQTVDSVAGPAPSTNPSLQPTGEAIVQERLAETPVYWPTIDDLELILMGYEVGVLQRLSLLRQYDRFAAVYAGRECLNGKERSFDGFRSFVGSNPDIHAQAGIVMQQIISSAEHRIALGLSAAEEGCMRPYMFPRASAELMLSVHLVQTAIAINPNNPFYEAFLTQLKQRAVSKCWDGKDQIFLRCAWKGKPEP